MTDPAPAPSTPPAAPPARSVRLRRVDRTALNMFARQTLVCAQEAHAEQVAFKRLQTMTTHVLRCVASEEDMLVLRRHESVVWLDSCVCMATRSGKQEWFEIPFLPRKSPDEGLSTHYRAKVGKTLRLPLWMMTKPIDLDALVPLMRADLLDAYFSYTQAVRAHTSARSSILNAIGVLVARAVTFDSLVRQWPAAEALRDKIAPQLPVHVPPPISDAEQVVQQATFVLPQEGEAS